jgi:3-dehydroquinate dehydratase-2
VSRIHVLNGVNLGHLGYRRPEVYGTQTLAGIQGGLAETFPDLDLVFRQTDHEGELVGWVWEAVGSDGIVLNPGAWSHYSYALHDALEGVDVPKVEVHLSNIHARDEDWRRRSVISPSVDAVVAGMGAFGYEAAVSYLLASGSR